MNSRFLCRALLLLPLCFFLLSAAPVWAWGCKGHQTVAIIAEMHLTPEARQFVEKLLSENPIDPQLKRYCSNATRDLLVDASTWPDDARSTLKNGPWHYIDIPLGASHGPLDPYCGSEGCVIKAIAEQLAVLKDSHGEPCKRADAIRYLVHFVADLHMPLHAATNNDEGGNCVPVRYFRRRPQEQHNYFAPNLHSLWDTAIPERDMEGADPSAYADFLSQMFASDFPAWHSAGIHVEDWAWESHDLAVSTVYGELTPKIPIESPVAVHSCADDNNVGARLLQLNLNAGQAYQDAAAPVVEKRLAQAGLRLALVLNEAAKSGLNAH